MPLLSLVRAGVWGGAPRSSLVLLVLWVVAPPLCARLPPAGAGAEREAPLPAVWRRGPARQGRLEDVEKPVTAPRPEAGPTGPKVGPASVLAG